MEILVVAAKKISMVSLVRRGTHQKIIHIQTTRINILDKSEM